MKLRNKAINWRRVLPAFWAMVLISAFFTVSVATTGVSGKHDSPDEAKVVIQRGAIDLFDYTATHTLSVVELNKDGYRFWGYYTGWNGNGLKTDMGLAYSNDLVHWVKDGPSPVVPDLRWGTVVVVDGTINMFGTRQYGGNSYIVRLTSQDGKNFTEQEKVVLPGSGERHQNPFIFYDEQNQMYRLYYFHKTATENRIEEKHSADVTRLANAPANLVMKDDVNNTLAAPSIFYREGKYWFFTETLRQINGADIWQTMAYVSDDPVQGFEPTDIDIVLADNDACFFPYVFDNRLNGFFSHKNADQTWELYRITHDFRNQNQISLGESEADLKVKETRQLTATFTPSNGTVIDASAAATWASSDNSVVTVHKGQITALKPGTAVITVSFGGVSAAVKENVLPA